MTDDEIDDLTQELYAHLKATEELAIRPEANRWLGEAQAVAMDLSTEGLPKQAVEKRVGQIIELLTQIEETDNQEADEHIESSLTVAAALKRRL